MIVERKAVEPVRYTTGSAPAWETIPKASSAALIWVTIFIFLLVWLLFVCLFSFLVNWKRNQAFLPPNRRRKVSSRRPAPPSKPSVAGSGTAAGVKVRLGLP